MKAGWVWLASFAVYPLLGAPLLAHPAFRRLGWMARTVLAGGVGAMLLSWTMTAFALARWRWSLLLVIVTAAVAFALRSLIPRASELPEPGAGEAGGSRASVRIAHLLTVVSLAAAFAATFTSRSTSADLLLFWGPKAQQFAAARTIDAAFLGAPNLEYLHVYYPPLVTNVFAFNAMIAGRFPWGAATLSFPLLLSATAVALFGILSTTRRTSAAAAVTALATSALALQGIRSAVAGNAEPFLLFFEVTAVALLLTPAAGTAAVQLLAGCLLAGAASAKVEGLPFALAVTVLFVLLERRRARPAWRAALRLLVPALVSVATWFAFGATRKIFYGYQGYGRASEFHWDHAATILTAVGIALWKVSYALPFAVPLLVFLLSGRPGRRSLLPLGVAAGITAFLLLAYLQNALDPSLWIAWSAARVLSPVTAMLALASFSAAERAP